MNAILKLENVNQNVGKKKLLSEISLELKKGVFYALIGANGAGKSTLIKTITGAYPQSQKTNDNKIIINQHLNHQGKNIFSYIPEWEMFSPHQKVLNFLREIAYLRKIPKDQYQKKIKESLKKFNLWEARKTKIKHLSSGMRKKLLFISAFLHDPKIVILDEPFANLDPPTKIEIINFLNEQKKQKLTALISSHMLSDIESIVDQVFFIKNGKLANSHNNSELNFVTIISNNLPIVCQYLKKQTIEYQTDGISKINFKLKKIKNLNQIIANAYQLADNQIVSVKINDLEQKYFSQ